MATTDIDTPSRDIDRSGPTTPLTAFERRTLALFASGCARGEIARLLNRAPKTISNSLTAARDKLGARSLAEAVALVTAETASISLKSSA